MDGQPPVSSLSVVIVTSYGIAKSNIATYTIDVEVEAIAFPIENDLHVTRSRFFESAAMHFHFQVLKLLFHIYVFDCRSTSF